MLLKKEIPLLLQFKNNFLHLEEITSLNMKKLLFLLVLLVSGLYAQTEDITQITIGVGSDITPQPISISSEFTHSQTLYYPDQLGFIGEITEIRFKTVFYYDALANSTQWIVKLGLSDKYQFTNTDDFIDSSTFTDVFSGTIEKQGYDVIVTFEESFYYDGAHNLVLDIEEIEPGAGPASEAFKGVKDFDNPPKRSLMTYTNFGETQKIAKNSYAQTEFRGDFTQCAQVATEPMITLENLTPETDYEVYVRSICSESNHSDWPPPLAFTTASLNVSDYENHQIKIYPNPTGDYVYIISNQPIKEFQLYDLQGRILKSGTLTPDTKINLSAFDSGFYLLKLDLEDGVVILEKMMKK